MFVSARRAPPPPPSAAAAAAIRTGITNSYYYQLVALAQNASVLRSTGISEFITNATNCDWLKTTG
jgi:hypothetical protein